MKHSAIVDLEILSESIVALDKSKIMSLVTHALRMHIPVQEIIDAAILGMETIGRLYEKGEYCISDLIVSGLIFESILEVDGIKENLRHGPDKGGLSMSGTIVAGTVEDDIHSIGKAIFRSMAMSVGFRVIDLGVDVPAQTFLNAAKKHQPDIVAVSALLTTGTNNIRRVSEALKNDPQTCNIYLLLGGTCATLDSSNFPLVDGFAVTAKESVDLCIGAMRRIDG